MARFDSVGIFWQDVERSGRGEQRARVMPPIPETTWVMPRDLPDLSRATAISFDVETFDPSIEAGHGPGWARGVGHICGISVGADDDGRWYFPMRHEIEPENNYDPQRILDWAKVNLGRAHQPKFGANLTYDFGWLKQEGVDVKGELHDVQFAEALLDSDALVALDVLGHKYLKEGKVTSDLYQWLADFYGGNPTAAQRKNIFRSPARLAAPYAMSDVDLPYRIIQKQWPILEREGLLDLYRLECDLIPLLVAMRFRGVSVDVEKAEQTRDALLVREKQHNAELKTMVGFEVNVDAGDSLAKAFTSLGLKFNYTKPSKNFPKGKPSFTKEFLKMVNHPVGAKIRQIRNVQKTRSTFIESYIIDAHVNGKIYPSIHQLKGDENGTVTGRFAMSNPNGQNLPSRDDEMGPLVRGHFRPDLGHKQWRKFDWSQLQYRFLAHYAVDDEDGTCLPGGSAEQLRNVFNTDPRADYHAVVQDIIRKITGIELGRKPVKNVNFGFVFGMGIDHLAVMLGLPIKEAKELAATYHEGVPYVKSTLRWASAEAQNKGIVTTILGRKTRFNLWEPDTWGGKDVERAISLPYAQALAAYGPNIRRGYTHKALNYKLQGSEGDLMKVCMLRGWNEGVFDATGVPSLTVHDELDFSDHGESDEAYEYLAREIMENSIKFRVPISVGCDVGPDWGACL